MTGYLMQSNITSVEFVWYCTFTVNVLYLACVRILHLNGVTSGTFAENLALPLHFQAGTGHLLFDDELFPGLSTGYRVTFLHQPQEFKNLRGINRGNSVIHLD